MNICDIMTKHPAHIGPNASIFAALNLLKDLDVRHLPVVENGQLVGIISDKDLKSLSAQELERASLDSTNFDLTSVLQQPVSDFMSGNIFFVSPEAPIAEAIDIMLDQRIGAVPVVDLDNSLVGVVSYVDILRAATKVL
jgi:CBS domain-containing protein